MSLASFLVTLAAGLCLVLGCVSLARKMNRKQRRVFIVGILIAVVGTLILILILQDPGFGKTLF